MKRLMMAMAAAAMLAGCGENEAAKPKSAAPKIVKAYAKMTSNDVVVVVNGKELTKGDIERGVAIQTAILRFANKKLTLADLERQQDKMRKTAAPNFVQRRIMLNEAARRGITLTDAERTAAREKFAKAVMRGGRAKYGLMAAALDGASRKELEEELENDGICEKMRTTLEAECKVTVTDDEVADKIVKFKEYNKRAKAEEETIWQSATNAWRNIRDGHSFETVGKRVEDKQKHVEFDPEWGSFELDQLADSPVLQHFVSRMKPGMFTPPVAGDNGVSIVRLNEIVKPDARNPKARYNLGQIFFALPEYYSQFTPETLKVELLREKSKRMYQSKFGDLVRASSISYPNGNSVEIFQGGAVMTPAQPK